MIQLGLQLVPTAFSEPSPAAPAEIGGHQIAESFNPGAPSGAVEDQPLFVSPPPLPFPRVYPGL